MKQNEFYTKWYETKQNKTLSQNNMEKTFYKIIRKKTKIYRKFYDSKWNVTKQSKTKFLIFVWYESMFLR